MTAMTDLQTNEKFDLKVPSKMPDGLNSSSMDRNEPGSSPLDCCTHESIAKGCGNVNWTAVMITI